MPDLSNLDLIPEEVPAIDYDAPESGSGFPPQLKPGVVYDFQFKLGVKGEGDEAAGDKPRLSFEAVEMQKIPVLQVNFTASTTVDGKEVNVMFQRANTFLSDKMRKAHMNHSLGELLRSLGIKLASPTKASIMEALKTASAEGKHFQADGVWRRYCKTDELQISTNPRQGDIKWPRAADGSFDTLVACPKCGVKAYGNYELNRFKLPATAGANGSGGHSVGGVQI